MASLGLLGPNATREFRNGNETISLPVVHQDHTIIGWKNCRIRLSNGRARFGGIATDKIYKREDTFVCPGITGSSGYSIAGSSCIETPSPHHRCGFYAWRERSNLAEVNAYIAQIELFGSVLECENGYRATKQRILGLYLPQRCFYCPKYAQNSYWYTNDKGITALSWPMCEDHIDAEIARKPLKCQKFELSHLSNMLGVEVSRYDQYQDF